MLQSFWTCRSWATMSRIRIASSSMVSARFRALSLRSSRNNNWAWPKNSGQRIIYFVTHSGYEIRYLIQLCLVFRRQRTTPFVRISLFGCW